MRQALGPLGVDPTDVVTLADLQKAWQTLTLVGVTQASGYKVPAVRLEGLDLVRFRGRLANNTGSTINSGTTLFTLPVGYRPSTAVAIPVTTSGASGFVITTAGACSLSTNLATSTGIIFDGVAFSIS